MQRWEPLHYLDNLADGAGYYFGSWYDPYNEDIVYIRHLAGQGRAVPLA